MPDTIDIYVSSLDRSLNMTTAATYETITATTPTGVDQEAFFYLPLDYMKNMFTLLTESNNLEEARNNVIGDSGTNDLIYRTKIDTKLHLNAARSTIKSPTLSSNTDITEWYTVDNVIYPGQCDVGNDFIRYIVGKKFKTHRLTSVLTNTDTLLSEIYTGLDTMWAEQKTTLFGNGVNVDTDGYYEVDDTNQANICREIYKNLMTYYPGRFSPVTNAEFTGDKMVESSGNVYEFKMPFIDGDMLSYLITIKSKSGDQFLTEVTRKYKINLVASSNAQQHVMPDNKLESVNVDNAETKPYTTLFANNIVDDITVKGTTFAGLCYTPP